MNQALAMKADRPAAVSAARPSEAAQASIPILGFYGHCNAGDEAFKLSFDLAFGNTPHHFVTRFEPNEKVPLAVFGGGAIFNDYFLKRVGGAQRIHVIGCSLPSGEGDVRHLEPVKDRIRSCYVRSRADVDALRNVGIDATYTPDIVFALRPRGTATLDDLLAAALLPPVGFSQERKKLFVFLSHRYLLVPNERNQERYKEIEKFQKELAAALDQLEPKFDIVMPSLSVWYGGRDYAFALSVVQRMKKPHRVCVVEKYFEPQALIDVIASTDCAILSMKFHGLVFGILNGKFVANLGSTRKTVDLMRDTGLSQLSFDHATATADHLLELVRKHRNENLLSRISAIAQDYRRQAQAALWTAAAKVKADL